MAINMCKINYVLLQMFIGGNMDATMYRFNDVKADFLDLVVDSIDGGFPT